MYMLYCNSVFFQGIFTSFLVSDVSSYFDSKLSKCQIHLKIYSQESTVWQALNAAHGDKKERIDNCVNLPFLPWVPVLPRVPVSKKNIFFKRQQFTIKQNYVINLSE